MTKNSPDVTPGQDISELITALSRGVNGSGVYRNVEYRVDGAEKMRGRLLQLLKWQDGQLVLDLKAPPVVEDNGPAMAVKEDDKDL